jgi:Zn-dependent metalloprotease
VKPASRFLSLVLFLGALVLATGLTGAATGTTAKSQDGPDPALVKKLKDNARGSVTISTKKATKFAGFIKVGQNGDLLPAETTASPQAKAQEFLNEYGGVLGAKGSSELVRSGTTEDRQGSSHVTYRQEYKGVPVYGATVKAHVDEENHLTAVNGIVVPDIDLGVSPKLSAAQAAATAIAAVVADPPANEATGVPVRVSAGDLRATSTTLLVYRMGLVRGVSGTNQLVYEVEVTDGAGIRDVVFVHAHSGKIVNRYSTIHDALFRRLFEMNTSNQVWQEGDPFPGALNQDQQNIVNFSGQSYWLYFNGFGRDSYDAAGHEMRSVNNDPRISCPNANWNGITTNYCNGVTSDDVVAHEWTHAYTQFTSNLIYQWQPGALNESYSDIFGETVDVLNGMQTDSPAPARDPTQCTTHTAGIPLITINSPAAIAGDCPTGGASFGPLFPTSGLTGNVVLALDCVSPSDPSPTNGCTALTNAAAIAGNVALVDRGVCAFTVKVKNAQNAGAIAVIVANNANAVLTMGGGNPTITIPSALTTLDKGNLIKGQLSAGEAVNVTIRDTAPPREDSYRWLLSEDATAFGAPDRHAIRDMWNPRCVSDPGKVSDAEYQCDTSDGGGVHTNSGVPNHGFALLVDGGMYNGVTVSAIGLTKAAHLYWRAQSVYQTPTSDFDDHADALEASCADLIGQNLKSLGVTSTPTGPSGQAITAADCQAVTAMIAAVELRRDPTQQCNFTPLLNKNTPSLCGPEEKNPPVVYEESFQDGLAGWTLSNQGSFSGWPRLDWAADSSLPGGRSGTAAFAADPDEGNCDGGAGDISGVMRLESPSIEIPAAGQKSPRLTFEHYVATEFQFDGGNVKVSINGGPYQVVPASAFSFNAYNTTLATVAMGSTNPLAGQPGFSGTDGGLVTGSWGQSQVDLSTMGVKPGDRIRIRFDFGIDGCAGIDGWYVDDVKVRTCNTKKDDKKLVARRET